MLSQAKGISLFRAIAMESFGSTHFINGLMHGFYYGRSQRAGDIADSQADNICFRVFLLISGKAPGDFNEQIAALQFGKLELI